MQHIIGLTAWLIFMFGGLNYALRPQECFKSFWAQNNDKWKNMKEKNIHKSYVLFFGA